MDAETVKKIAHLARIALDETDIPEVTENLNKVMALIDEMNEINTDGVEPMLHPLDLTQRLRNDEVVESNRRDEFLAIAPKTKDGLFLVPQVVE